MHEMIKIPVDEVKFELSSFIDPVGRVFYWKDKVYRALRKQNNSNIELLENANIELIYLKGLVRTEKTNYSLPGFDQIITHEKINFVSYPVEWCSPMLKDAGLLVLDLQEEA